jgi:hypothetical protein
MIAYCVIAVLIAAAVVFVRRDLFFADGDSHGQGQATAI